MHIIDRSWTDLAAGYQAVQSFKTKLAAEFGRAVRVGHKQQFRKELTEWQKKRRVFFALVAVALLSIIALCLTALYFRDVACIIIYWAVLVLIILVTLAVAGRQYVREMVNGKPLPQPSDGLVVDLEGRWWDSLSTRTLTVEKYGENGGGDFLAFLARSLPDDYFAQNLTGSDGLLLGPSGIWLFRVEDWSGTIVRVENTWKQIQTVRDKLWQKRLEEKTQEPGPDDQWLSQKQGMVNAIEKNMPKRAWIVNLVQGGVVFSHPKVYLDKDRIQGSTASYGVPRAWVERILHAPPVEGFTLDIQLEILDVLAEPGSRQTVSASGEAERLYQQAVEELRAFVARWVK